MRGKGKGGRGEGEMEKVNSFTPSSGSVSCPRLKLALFFASVVRVVRTHPVHPELTSGNFLCLECQTAIPDVEQQFKFTEPTVCKNPLCQNRRRFMLEVNSSRFVDFQKIRVQETQQELPRGSIPRRWVWPRGNGCGLVAC